MTANIIDGKTIAADIRGEVARRAAELRDAGVIPGLATVLVGDNAASHKYVSMKRKACAEAGIESFHTELPDSATQAEVLALVERLGADPAVHGILVQLPLPKQIDEETILNAVPLSKDVDGFHPLNIGALAMKGREGDFIPCTPHGVIELLDRSGAQIEGANAVVLGRSNIVGMPVALLLIQRNATVTRPYPQYAAIAGWQPYRSTAVGAQSETDQTPRHGGNRAVGRSSGDAVKCGRVQRSPVVNILPAEAVS